MHYLGLTRSAHCADHILQTPDTFVQAPLPGMHNATAIVHISPARGARFTQFTAVLTAGGRLAPCAEQRFAYVLDGEVQLKRASGSERLIAADYIYSPPGFDA